MVTADAVTLLRDLGAEDIAHSGGNLFDHLVRVHDRLAEWGADRTLRLAGLCHAFYGTDGFAVALYGLERRAELAALIGAEAEELVYFYASCDRRASYPGLPDEQGEFVDRFSGVRYRPELRLRRAFAELTVANELDFVAVNPLFDEIEAEGYYALFAPWLPLLSPAACGEVERAYG
ncbi:DUF6817 domain-containing protein [Yinghuangia soli]|uniref:DUF6817 domain-containing protein n=1 Tax=Yinghuangia soli TaxID=2908204 RepID=A0AA41PW14_9ACTN|nr:hypothetical protein [Yinghuangia soli]MCF2526773.1 hypothetical protein [Yinghuangia soli]